MDSDLPLTFAIWGNLAAFGSATAMLLFALGARWRRQRDAAVHLAVEETWKPVLFQRLAGNPAALPPLRGRQAWIAFTRLWVYYRNSLRGTPQDVLNRLAEEAGLREMARRMLHWRNMDARMLGVAALGHLGDEASAPLLSALLHHRHITLSLYAAKAVAQIDPRGMAPELVTMALERKDWPLPKVATILNHLDKGVVCRELASAAEIRPASELANLVRLVHAVQCPQSDEIARSLLARYEDSEVVIAALGLLARVESLSHLYALLLHENWAVRVQAVAALGRILSPRHLDFLLPMLADVNWWVRYRAAQAVANVLHNDIARLAALSQEQQDRYARDILNQVVAELTVA